MRSYVFTRTCPWLTMPHTASTPTPCRYQGEANVDCNYLGPASWELNYYQRLLPQLVQTYKALFKVNFTTLVVQLAPYTNTAGFGNALPALRQAQAAAARTLPRTGVAYPIDLGDDIRDVYPNPGV